MLYNLIYTSDIGLEELTSDISNLKFRYHQNEAFYNKGKINAETHQIENIKIFNASQEIISEIEQRFSKLES